MTETTEDTNLALYQYIDHLIYRLEEQEENWQDFLYKKQIKIVKSRNVNVHPSTLDEIADILKQNIAYLEYERKIGAEAILEKFNYDLEKLHSYFALTMGLEKASESMEIYQTIYKEKFEP
jgi:hypothetical protein